ncbi:MAG TPA: DUF4160 domain-containing protein [Thermodesulfovibrionia bacterium]|nr:DUF4160 domain-containing protein [Thermodesulfovibrionia bacterium]
MPTVFRFGPYRFFFYAGDKSEPPHIHIEREDKTAKFWLVPVRLHNSRGLTLREINKLHKVVEHNRENFLRVWHEYFND